MQVLAVFQDLLTAPEFRQDKVDLGKDADCAAPLRAATTIRTVSSAREFANILYGRNTPYGWEIEYADIDNIQRQDLVEFLPALLLPGEHHAGGLRRFLHR